MEDVVKVQPGTIRGSAPVPASKSLCHRAILAAALAEGSSTIEHVSFSEDIEATLMVAKQLGATIQTEGDSLVIKGIGKYLPGDKEIRQIDCHESGSTLRFVVPILAALGIPAHYFGKGKLAERPMTVYFDLFDKQQVQYEVEAGKSLPLTVKTPLKAGKFLIDGSISSQFVTGLLMALPLLEEDSELQIQGKLESRPYVNLTLHILKMFGIQIEEVKENCFKIPGRQQYQPAHYRVEADASQAAFFICAASIAGDKEGILIEDLQKNTAQGDLAFLEVLAAFGGRYQWEKAGLRVYPAELAGSVSFNVSQCPDIVPILAVLGTYARGTLQITGAARLRMKESDRLAAITQELNGLGGKIEEHEDGLTIHHAALQGGTAESWNDHRIAMSMAVAALGCQSAVEIHGADSVRKSWPTFWHDLERIKQ